MSDTSKSDKSETMMTRPLSCEDFETLRVELMMNEISAQDKGAVDDHIRTCERCQQEMSTMEHLWSQLNKTQELPTDKIRNNFYAMLASEMEKQHATKRRTDWMSMFRILWLQSPQWAVAYSLILLVSGILIGQSGEPAVQAPQLPAGSELSQILDEVNSLKSLIALNLLEQDSAQARLQGVSYAQQISHQDHRLLSSLMEVAATDRTRNVRLAALDALYRYQHEPELTAWVEQQLPQESSLLVQLKLAEILLESAGTRRGERLNNLLAEGNLQHELKSYLREEEMKSTGGSGHGLR